MLAMSSGPDGVRWDLSLLVATLIGGLLAAGAGWLQSFLTAKARREEFTAEVQARRVDVALERGYDKADGIVLALRYLWMTLTGPRKISVMLMPQDFTEREAVRDQIERVRADSLYLPLATQQQVKDCLDLLLSVEQLHALQVLDEWPRFVGARAIDFAIDAVGCHLRQDPPADLPTVVAGYIKDMREYDEYTERQLEEQIDAEEARRVQAGDD